MSVAISLQCESRFPVNRKQMRTVAEKVISDNLVRGEVYMEILVVGDRKMHQLNQQYRKIDDTTSVLAFALEDPIQDVAFIPSPDQVLRLGAVVISYPQAILRAEEDEMMVDEKIVQLLEHGIKHLLGIGTVG